MCYKICSARHLVGELEDFNDIDFKWFYALSMAETEKRSEQSTHTDAGTDHKGYSWLGVFTEGIC